MTAVAGDRPILIAIDVHKRFGHNEVLKGVSLEVRRGEVICIIGPSGSGKTTFLRCINHLERIDSGRIEVGGHLIGYRERPNGTLVEESPKEIARQRSEIGFVFQRFNLWPHLTALENIIEAPIYVRGERREEAIAARRAATGACRAGRQARCLPQQALRWTAAAGSDRAGAGDAAEPDAL